MTIKARGWAAAFVLLLAVAAGCSAGDERPMKYLQALPEDGLVYPGATLTCTRSNPEKQNFDDPGHAKSWHCYTAAASESAVVAWYAEELAARGWKRQDVNAGTKTSSPQWIKGFTTLQIGSVGAMTDTNPDSYDFTVTLLATGYDYDPAPIAGLLALPESGLAYPASTDPRNSEFGRSISANSAEPARIELMARTAASVDEVMRYFDRELLARGWQAASLPPSAFHAVGDPTRAWQKGDVAAGLFAVRVTSGTPSATFTSYRFMIAEVLGPDQTPGVPWK